MKILTEQQQNAVKRATVAMLLSPVGRDWSRPFLTERGKGEDGNLGQIKKELLDILSEVINELYASPEPIQSKAIL